MLEKRHLTHDSFLAEKDVDNSNVLLPGVVKFLLKEKNNIINVYLPWSL